MSSATEVSVIDELELEKYLTRMDSPLPVTIPSPDPERRNPLNESFEDKCELCPASSAFIARLTPAPLPKLQRFIFNHFAETSVLLLRKVARKQSRLPVCLAVLFRMSQTSSRTVLVFRDESRGRKYFNKLRELSQDLATSSHFGAVGSLILNDKRAVQKPHRLLGFTLPRLVNLVAHKALEFQSVALFLFVDVEAVVAAQSEELTQFVDLHRTRGRDTRLAFIANDHLDDTTAVLSDCFGSLTHFENRAP